MKRKPTLEKVIEAAEDIRSASAGLPVAQKHEVLTRWGFFPDLPQAEFLADGKLIKLLADFVYVRPDGAKMTAPAGFRSDGASIPKLAWPVADSPFTGKNLFPALIHDYYCGLGKLGLSPWSSSDVHYMFHQGLRARGERAWLARIKWAVVRTVGPRFDANPST